MWTSAIIDTIYKIESLGIFLRWRWRSRGGRRRLVEQSDGVSVMNRKAVWSLYSGLNPRRHCGLAVCCSS